MEYFKTLELDTQISAGGQPDLEDFQNFAEICVLSPPLRFC